MVGMGALCFLFHMALAFRVESISFFLPLTVDFCLGQKPGFNHRFLAWNFYDVATVALQLRSKEGVTLGWAFS
jgi:hypothetical protein